MKTIIKNISFAVLAIGVMASCDDDRGYDDYDPGMDALGEMSGEWFIDITDEATGDVLVSHALHSTVDSNQGNGTMVINDFQNGWYLGGNINVDINNLTFTATDQDNFQDPGTTFTLTDGKILKDAATSPTGAVVDSIYFRGTFSYDPETVLIFSGRERTGFIEEE